MRPAQLVLAAGAVVAAVLVLTLTGPSDPDQERTATTAPTTTGRDARAPSAAERLAATTPPPAAAPPGPIDERDDATAAARRFARGLIAYERTGKTAALEADATAELTIELAATPPRSADSPKRRARVAQVNVIFDPQDPAHATAVVVIRRGGQIGQGLELDMRKSDQAGWKVTAVG